MTKRTVHQSVLTEEIMRLIRPKSGGIYLDGTFGGGGHSEMLLSHSQPAGKVYATDRDPNAQEFAQRLEDEYESRFVFKAIPYEVVATLQVKFDGAVLDLGLSSDQLEQSGRGFSFNRNEPLDMRFNPSGGQTASQLLGQTSIKELERIFYEYAEDRHGAMLARKITSRRRDQPIRTTFDLVNVIGTTNPKVLARIFQALRIEVNDELNHLKRGLDEVTGCLKVGGVIAVVTFHSLEDRIVKDFMRENLEVLTKKPIIPSEQEISANSRARSAKLRGGRKVD